MIRSFPGGLLRIRPTNHGVQKSYDSLTIIRGVVRLSNLWSRFFLIRNHRVLHATRQPLGSSGSHRRKYSGWDSREESADPHRDDDTGADIIIGWSTLKYTKKSNSTKKETNSLLLFHIPSGTLVLTFSDVPFIPCIRRDSTLSAVLPRDHSPTVSTCREYRQEYLRYLHCLHCFRLYLPLFFPLFYFQTQPSKFSRRKKIATKSDSRCRWIFDGWFGCHWIILWCVDRR